MSQNKNNNITIPDCWINIHDKKPDKYGQYLVLRRDKEYELCDIKFYNVQKNVWQYDALNSYTYNDVIAWMPLPPLR
jgi:hypothetical protein